MKALEENTKQYLQQQQMSTPSIRREMDEATMTLPTEEAFSYTVSRL